MASPSLKRPGNAFGDPYGAILSAGLAFRALCDGLHLCPPLTGPHKYLYRGLSK